MTDTTLHIGMAVHHFSDPGLNAIGTITDLTPTDAWVRWPRSDRPTRHRVRFISPARRQAKTHQEHTIT